MYAGVDFGSRDSVIGRTVPKRLGQSRGIIRRVTTVALDAKSDRHVWLLSVEIGSSVRA
jgi:hypothetical protein